MTLAPIFHRECDPVELDEAHHYVVFSCLQWKNPNLEALPQAAKQRFAVLYHRPLDESSIMETLERAHIQGAMSGVKLVAVSKDAPYIFLSHEVASSTFPAIELLWTKVREMDRNRRLAVDFGSETEIYSGRSDYAFWRIAREVLDSELLGIKQYQISALDFIDDDLMLDPFCDETEKTSADEQTPELVQSLRERNSSAPTSNESGHSPRCLPRENRYFSLSEIESIGQAVAGIGNLRDACLYALMLERFRVNEITEIQVIDVKTLHPGVTVNVRLHKTRLKSYHKVLSAYAGALIILYIDENGLSGEDLLFPSQMDARRPMSRINVSQLFWSWLSESKIEQKRRSPGLIRQSIPPRD
ncbi:hypothetical protein ACX3YC_26460 [Pseudomonas mohnii]